MVRPPVVLPAAARTPTIRRPRSLLVAVLIAATALVGTALPSFAAGSSTPPGAAWVRVAHLVPGLGATQIDVVPATAGTPSTTAIEMSPKAAYGDVTKYRQLKPESYQVQVRMSGAASSSAPMLSRNLTLVSNQAYTLAVLGSAAAPRLEVLADDLTPPAAHDARVRLLPAASQAPEVSVAAQNGPTIAENAVLGQASAYASVPAGVWKLRTTAAKVAPVVSSIKVASGSVYTLLVLDGQNGSPRLQLITDAAGTSSAPKGGAQTGGGGMATEFVGHAPSSWSGHELWLSLSLVFGLVLALGGAAGGVRRGQLRRGQLRRRAVR